jgi:hypothetical protein
MTGIFSYLCAKIAVDIRVLTMWIGAILQAVRGELVEPLMQCAKLVRIDNALRLAQGERRVM